MSRVYVGKRLPQQLQWFPKSESSLSIFQTSAPRFKMSLQLFRTFQKMSIIFELNRRLLADAQLLYWLFF